jgi:hypothetical protein
LSENGAPAYPIGVLATKGSYAIDALVAWGGIPCAHVNPGNGRWPNPYSLPVIERGQTVVVASNWLWAFAKEGRDPLRDVLVPLRRRFDRVVGLDHADPFQLDFPEPLMQDFDVVLKVNGIYRDRDLYNWLVGAPRPDGRWVERVDRRSTIYSPRSLDKLRLSVPCFLGTSRWFRQRTRHLYGKSAVFRLAALAGDRVIEALPDTRLIRARKTVHFAGSLTHVQRLTAARLLRTSGLTWEGGLTQVPTAVTGLRGNGLCLLSEDEREWLRSRIRSERLGYRPRNRLHYLAGMLECRTVLSVTGYGEICFRMAEAWAMRRVLVCQDLSHVETLFPLRAGQNVVYCRPDLQDLVDVLRDLEHDHRRSDQIAVAGHRMWSDWLGDPARIMKSAFEPALGP